VPLRGLAVTRGLIGAVDGAVVAKQPLKACTRIGDGERRANGDATRGDGGTQVGACDVRSGDKARQLGRGDLEGPTTVACGDGTVPEFENTGAAIGRCIEPPLPKACAVAACHVGTANGTATGSNWAMAIPSCKSIRHLA
jgi:hypothetical protein